MNTFPSIPKRFPKDLAWDRCLFWYSRTQAITPQPESPMDFREKYKDVQMTFHNYYKFTFGFVGVAPDGTKVSAEIGGSSEDIYRFEVIAGKSYRLGDGVDSIPFENIGVVCPVLAPGERLTPFDVLPSSPELKFTQPPPPFQMIKFP